MRFKKAETLFVEGGDDENAAAAAAPPQRRPASSSSSSPGPGTGAAPKLDASNPGYSMLRSMGWSESNPGLGRTGQGRREPIEAVPRRARAGLGCAAAAAAAEREKKHEQQQQQQKQAEETQRRHRPPPPAPPVDPAVAAARQRGAALVAELLSRDLAGGFGGPGSGSVDASQRALNPLLDSEGAPARRHRRRNPLLQASQGDDDDEKGGGESVKQYPEN